jgi:NTP pyrophosphatase (non-canonical NTP hydrolase)
MDIKETQEAMFLIAQDHGWWDTADDCNVPTKLALAAGELVGEALEAFRNDQMDLSYVWRDPTDGKLKRVTPDEMRTKIYPVEFVETLDGEKIDVTNQSSVAADPSKFKPEGFGIELADAIIRIMDLAEWLDIDLAEMIGIKAEYNKSRPMRHGGKKV